MAESQEERERRILEEELRKVRDKYKGASDPEGKRLYDAAKQGQQEMAEEYGTSFNMEEMQKAISEGKKEGEKEAMRFSPDIDYKAEASDILKRQKAAREKGLTAEEYAPVKQRFRTSSRALRGALASAGVRGETAGQTIATAYRGAQEQMAALDAAVRDRAAQQVQQTIAQHEYKRVALPLAYARLRSGQLATQQQLALAQQKTPEAEKPGFLTSVFGKLI